MQFGATTLNLASIVTHHARLSPEREAVVWDDVRITYGDLDRPECLTIAFLKTGTGHRLPDHPAAH